MSGELQASGPLLRRLWLFVLAPPFAWAAALGVLFTLTDGACHGARGWLVAAGVLFILLSAAPGFIAWRQHGRTATHHGDADYVRFLLELGVGSAIVFTLVNLLSTIPIFLLSACPG
jgi:hypothetical protein